MNQKIAELTCFKGFHQAGRILSKTGFYVPILPDMGSIPTYPKKLKTIAREMAKMIKPWKPDLIASPELRGIPYGTAVSLETGLPFIMIRKKPKGYQLGKVIEGDFKKGQRVVIVDDGIASGKTKDENIAVLKTHGLKPIGVAIFFSAWKDRICSKIATMDIEQWARSRRLKFGYLVTWEDCIKLWVARGLMGRKIGELLLCFLDNPGVWEAKKENWKNFKELAKKEKNLIFHKSFKEI